MHSIDKQDRRVSCDRPAARKHILALPMLLAALTLGGCEVAERARSPEGVTQIFVAGERDYANLTDAQRDAFQTVRQEFSDPVMYPTAILISFTRALYPGLWGLKEGSAMYLKIIAERRQAAVTAAITAASQTAISSQMTLNAPSQDASANPTALDGRRSEAANGHPAY